MISISTILFERYATQEEVRRMMLNTPQAREAAQGVQVAPGVVVPPTAAGAPAAAAVQQRVVPVAQVQQVASAPAAAAVQTQQVIPPKVAATAKRLGVSPEYQNAMNKSFNQFKAETGRLPKVAGDRQVGPINPADQARINQLHKQYMTGVPAKTAAPVKVASDVVPPAGAPAAAKVTTAAAQELPNDAAKAIAKTQGEISGSEAAGIAAKKGISAAGEAIGSAGKKAFEFAGEHPVAGGLAAGAIGALGLKKLLQRNRSA